MGHELIPKPTMWVQCKQGISWSYPGRTMLLPRYLMVECFGPEGKAESFNLNLDQKVFLLKTVENAL